MDIAICVNGDEQQLAKYRALSNVKFLHFYRIPQIPEMTSRGEKCYVVMNGNIVGYHFIEEFRFFSTEDAIKMNLASGGYFVLRRADPWVELPIPVKFEQFEGYRYIRPISCPLGSEPCNHTICVQQYPGLALLENSTEVHCNHCGRPCWISEQAKRLMKEKKLVAVCQRCHPIVENRYAPEVVQKAFESMNLIGGAVKEKKEEKKPEAKKSESIDEQYKKADDLPPPWEKGYVGK